MSIFASKHLFILLINCSTHFQFVRQFALAGISLLTLASARGLISVQMNYKQQSGQMFLHRALGK